MPAVCCWIGCAVTNPTHPLVIGYGNPLREDDGIGRHAAELLEAQLPPQAAEIVQCHQLTPELSAKLDGASVVIFLDASVNLAPGEIACQPVRGNDDGVWSHDLSPAQLLGLAGQLNGGTPRAFLISAGVERMDLGTALTPGGEESAIRVARAAKQLLKAEVRCESR